MKDFKNLSNKKTYSFSSFLEKYRKKNRIKHNGLPGMIPATAKKQGRPKDLLLFIAVVVGLTPLFLLSFHYAPTVVKTFAFLNGSRSASNIAEAVSRPPTSSFSAANALLGNATDSGDALTARTSTGDTLHYSIRLGLQKKVYDFMAANKVPYGVFVAIEPDTGRILAMTSYSSISPGWQQNSFYDLYPMASLFKIVTASAALENKKINPNTVVEFRGNSYSENPRYWDISRRGGNSKIDLTLAMGKSINPVYGRVAADIAGKASVMKSVEQFGFNQTLLPGTPVKESRADEPASDHELMRMGAGLNHDVKISPLHAAVIMAAIANHGVMMQPALTDRVTDSRGNVRENHSPRNIRQLVSPETASSLTRMLSTTVTSGTSRRAFHDRRGRPLLNVDVAAKTGSINGTDPRGHHSWFAAYAPADNPKIALVALVINNDKWKIKSAHVGEQALAEFFRKR